MLPLLHRRVLVTRPRGRSPGLASRLEELGAEAIVVPTIEIAPPESYCALHAALAMVRSFDWVVFTSATAVEVFAEQARRLGVRAGPRRLAVIGPATARAAEESGVRADDGEVLMPSRFVAEDLARALLPFATGARMLLPRAAVARDVLPELLGAAGAEMTVVEAYQTVVARGAAEELRRVFGVGAPDAVMFTSASTVYHLSALLREAGLELPGEAVLASIGPITSQAMRECGWEPGAEAGEATVEALVGALVGALVERVG